MRIRALPLEFVVLLLVASCTVPPPPRSFTEPLFPSPPPLRLNLREVHYLCEGRPLDLHADGSVTLTFNDGTTVSLADPDPWQVYLQRRLFALVAEQEDSTTRNLGFTFLMISRVQLYAVPAIIAQVQKANPDARSLARHLLTSGGLKFTTPAGNAVSFISLAPEMLAPLQAALELDR